MSTPKRTLEAPKAQPISAGQLFAKRSVEADSAEPSSKRNVMTSFANQALRICVECGESHDNPRDEWCDRCRGGFLKVGKHSGESFRKVFETDVGYCRWVMREKRTGNLAEFSDWLSGMPVESEEEETPILRVGKHRGETFEEVYENDEDYCDWILSEDIERGSLFEFREWLKCRSQ